MADKDIATKFGCGATAWNAVNNVFGTNQYVLCWCIIMALQHVFKLTAQYHEIIGITNRY